MSEEQINTQKAEGNSESNPSTQADKNDVPYSRFQEVNQSKNQFKSENESLKAELEELKMKQEKARQESLKKNSEFETLYNEADGMSKKLAEQNKVLQSDIDSFRDGLINQIPENRRYIAETMSMENLQKFVKEEQLSINSGKATSSRAGGLKDVPKDWTALSSEEKRANWDNIVQNAMINQSKK
jgi:predicted nuclease with TOPRIM domain